MKIVIIPSAELSYNSGSVIYAKMLFEYLLNEGHQVYMLGNCIPDDIDEKYKKFIKVGSDLLFHPIIDDRVVSDIQYMKMHTNILDIITEIYEEWGKIDVIHAHYASINSYSASCIKKFLNIPFVVSSFGRDINIGWGCDERIKTFISESLPFSSRIVVSEDELGKKIIDIIPKIKENKIITIPMPLDDRILQDGVQDIIEKDSDAIIISSINSCFTPEKGIDDVLEAFALISKNTNCKLYIAGQDDDEKQLNYKKIIRKISELNIKDKVYLLGYISREQVGKLLEQTDIFIDARYKGNFSSVLLEAQFKKSVTFASDNDEAKKIITNGQNGLLYPVGNVKLLANTIEKLIYNKELYNNLEKGMNKWCNTKGKEYNKEYCLKKIMQVLFEAKK